MENTLSISPSYQAVLSPQGQITVPVEIRRLMNLKPGASLSLMVKTVRKNLSAIIAYVKPNDPWEKYYGIGKEFYEKLGGSEKVIAEERRSWGNR